MKSKIKFVLLFGILITISITTKAQISLVQDMLKTLNIGGSDPNSAIEMRGILYFVATDPSIGAELWRTDGTTLGTYLVKDIKPGSGSSTPMNLIVFKDTLYFSADDGTNGRELWKSDGTENGTDLLADIYTGSSKWSANSSNPANFLIFNDTLYFSATGTSATGTYGNELYKTDGSELGTKLFKDLYPGSVGFGGANSSKPQYLTLGKGCFYFQATDSSANGVELFKSDGTTAGTKKVKNINTFNKKGSNPRKFISLNDTMYFLANDSFSGEELWKTDGTAAGTVIVKDIQPGKASSNIASIVNFKNKLYFQAEEPTFGAELWMSNGTEAGTSRVIDIYTGANNSGYPSILTVFNGSLYFSAQEALHGFELWKSDGTLAGTAMLKDINFGTGPSSPDMFRVNGSKMFFVAQTSLGNELWITDGTSGGTTQVKDIRTGNSSNPRDFYIYKSKLFFSADDGKIGREPWMSDGTLNGTTLLKDIYSGTLSSNPTELTEMNGYVYFVAYTSASGSEIYRTNGTGTSLLRDIFAGTNSSTPKHLMNVGNVLFFSADADGGGYELWKSSGTSATTMRVKDVNTGYMGSQPDSFCNVNGILYFTQDDGTHGFELWRSNGSQTTGTYMVKDIDTGLTSSNPNSLINTNGGKVYFKANDGIHGEELWRSDGTDTGTYMVLDIRTGSASSSPDNLYYFNGNVYFQANEGTNGVELWQSNVATKATIMLKDIYSGSGFGGANSSNPKYFADLNGRLYFQAASNNVGTELWQSDGTKNGTVLFKDIYTGSGYGGANSSSPQYLTKVSNYIYFTAKTKNEGTELWKTNGTAAGTILAKDINPGVKSSNPYNFFVVGSSLFFVANDGKKGAELWKAENNICGKIVLTGEIDTGTIGTGPTYLASLNPDVYFAASNTKVGNEIWKYKDTYIPAYTTNVGDTICDGDSIKTGIHYYKKTGIYSDTMKTTKGCDSLIITTLLVNSTSTISKPKSICIGDSIKIAEIWRSTAGTYTEKFISVNGCDSNIDVVLSLSPKPTTPVIHKEGTATLKSSSATGNQWYDNDGIIVGSTGQTIMALKNLNYYVIVTIDGCSSDQSNKINPKTSISNDNFRNLNIYPNPVTNKLIIEFEGNQRGIYTYYINNLEGQSVIEGKLTDIKNQIDVSNIPKGIYFVKIIFEDQIGLFKMIKE